MLMIVSVSLREEFRGAVATEEDGDSNSFHHSDYDASPDWYDTIVSSAVVVIAMRMPVLVVVESRS